MTGIDQQPHGIGSFIKKINNEYQNEYDTTEQIINLGDTEATIDIGNSKVSSGPVSTSAQTYKTNFHSLESFSNTTAGSTGAVGIDDFGGFGYAETGSAESEVYSMLYKTPGNFATLYPYFDFGDKFRACAGVDTGFSNGVAYVFRGRTTWGNGDGYGFKFENTSGTNDIWACVNKGGTEHTQLLKSDIGVYLTQLYAQVDWENQRTVFRYGEADPGYETQEVIINEVPTGYADRMFTLLCHNKDGSTNVRVKATEFMMENGPASAPPETGW